MASEHKFQVNLQGVIDLLSDHLYASPRVFLRELMQNCVDAIVARTKLEKEHEGKITIQVIPATQANPATLVIEDNGVGLTESEVHQFLATIGQSSKRGAAAAGDFIGQFGIGLLSAFVVSEEIVVVTRSLASSEALEWRGRADGTYSLKSLQGEFPVGTQVHLRPKESAQEMFTVASIRDTASHFGSFLTIPIEVVCQKQCWSINATPPWNATKRRSDSNRQKLLEYGDQLFHQRFLDAIPLYSKAGEVEGVAFVMEEAAAMTARRSHRVYLKNMLLTEEADNLMPAWAFFVKCVVNAKKLRPTASRESFYEDERLEKTRDELGDCIKAHLLDLAQNDRTRLDLIIGRHHLAIKSLAMEDEEFYKLFIDWLPFETNMGVTTLEKYFRDTSTLRHVPSLDLFRQVASIASAQSLTIFNSGYVYDVDLLQKLTDVFPDRVVQQVELSEITESFGELTDSEQDLGFEFLRTADRVLQPFRCASMLRKFLPETLPCLYTANDTAHFLRSVDQSREDSTPLWDAILDGVSKSAQQEAYSQLCFNYRNPLIVKLVMAAEQNPALARRAVESLYAQALMMAHIPLKQMELSLLTNSLLSLLEMVLESGPTS